MLKPLSSILVVLLISNVHAWPWSSVEEVKPIKEDLPVVQTNPIDHEHKLSDQEHYIDTDGDGKFEHNSDYDHEAFLGGQEEVDKFKAMKPEESKKKLEEIVDKIDADNDGSVTVEELRDWIANVSRRAILGDVESRWEQYQENGTLADYLDKRYGQLKQWTEKEKELNKIDFKSYEKMMKRDEKKFNAADQDKDGKLNKKEYTDFLHPEESPLMRDIVINETLEDLDVNEDGLISVEEFIKDFYDGIGSDEPDWVKSEREYFKHVRDINKDNVLDREELADWILPQDFDKSLREAQHLIHEVDKDKDGKLAREEIMDKYEVFVASTATNYGQDLDEREDL